LVKYNLSCLKNCLTKVDNFSIEFTEDMGWKERTLLLAAVFMVDFGVFERPKN